MKKVLLTILLCLSLSACCRLDAEIDIDTQANSTASGTLQISSDALSQIGFSIDNMVDLIGRSGFDLKQNEFGYTYDTDNHLIGINFRFDGSDYVNAVRTGQEMTVTFNPISKSELVDLDVFGDGSNDYTFLKDLGAEMTLKIKMPGPIRSFTKGEKISYDTISFDLFEDMSDVEITSYAFDIYFFMSVGIGVLTVIVLALHYTSQKTKKMAVSANDHTELLK